MKKIFSFLAVMLMAVTAYAATINVTPGDDKLIAALSEASAGDVLILADGAYNEYSNYIDFNKTITVQAAEGAKPIVNVGCYIKVQGGATVKLQGIKFDGKEQGHNGSSYSYFFRVYDADANNSLELEDCEICNTKANYAIRVESSKKLKALKINNCYFHDGSNSAILIEKSSSQHACDNVEITNSTFANFGGFNQGLIAINTKGGAIAATAEDDMPVLMDHCTFYNITKTDAGSTYGVLDVRKSAITIVKNCIFANPATLPDGAAAAHRATQLYGGTVSNCLLFNTPNHRTDAITLEGALKDVDPKFVDAANGNYTLGEGSPAIDAGTDGKSLGDPRWWPSVAPEVKYYLKNNWDAASDWTWKEMTKIEDGNYKLEGVVFGGTGVNVNTAESDEGSDWYPIEKISTFDANEEPTTLKAKDTVMFGYMPNEKVLVAIVVGPYVEPSGVEHTYTVAGSSAVAFGTAWDPTNTANDMAKQDDGSYKWEKANLELPAGTIEFKVCQDHAWTTCWPAQNYALNVSEAATYTLKITFTPASGNVGAELVKTGSAEIDPTVSAKGSWDGWAAEVVFVLADNKETATGALNLEPGNYEFKVILNGGDWRSNGYSYHREFTGAEGITGNGDNMVLKADIAGEYTLTWTFATNALNITFPVASGIDNTNVAVKAQKMIINGQLFIIRDGQMFNAQGQLQ